MLQMQSSKRNTPGTTRYAECAHCGHPFVSKGVEDFEHTLMGEAPAARPTSASADALAKGGPVPAPVPSVPIPSVSTFHARKSAADRVTNTQEAGWSAFGFAPTAAPLLSPDGWKATMRRRLLAKAKQSAAHSTQEGPSLRPDAGDAMLKDLLGDSDSDPGSQSDEDEFDKEFLAKDS